MLDQIKGLYDLGFSIIWLMPRSKRPVDTGWTSNERHTWEVLKALHKENFNVGVRLDKTSKLADGNYLTAIDCDVKSQDPVHLKEMEHALDKLGFDWMSAPTVLSGRGNGSRHIYCKSIEPAKSFTFAKSAHPVKVFMPSASGEATPKDKEYLTALEIKEGYRIRPAWEISVMGVGRQVVLPPSIHPDSGKEYEWRSRVKSHVDFPLVDLAKEKAPLTYTVKQSPEFQACIVDLTCSKLPTWAVELIEQGKGLEKYGHDRSAAMYAVTLIMLSKGFSDMEIMTVLTDPENELSRAAYEHRKTKDRKNAAEWVYKYTVQKAKHERSAEKAFEDHAEIEDRKLTEEEKELQDNDLLGDWRDRLDRNHQNNLPKATLRNCEIILKNITDKQIFGFNEFYHSEFYLSDPPWRPVGEPTWVGQEIKDVDLARMKYWFGDRFGFEPSKDNMEMAISKIAHENVVHPVRKYLDGLMWDGVPRIDGWLKYYLGAQGPDEYLQAVGAKLLCAGVGRIMEPGCKWDYVVILEGLQGIGKSSACEILSVPWFSDTLGDITNKDAVESLRGKWIIEIGELAVMRRNETESLKQFITVKYDNVRKAYARKSETFRRQCIFIGTTNRDDYLKDETGNRRFWPVKVTQCKFDVMARDRDQLWAEAYVRWMEGEQLFLNKQLQKVAEEIQSQRIDMDEWCQPIKTVLENEFQLDEGFSLMEIWKAFAKWDLDGTKFSMDAQRRLGRCLRLMGYEKKHVWEDGKTHKKWYKR